MLSIESIVRRLTVIGSILIHAQQQRLRRRFCTAPVSSRVLVLLHSGRLELRV